MAMQQRGPDIIDPEPQLHGKGGSMTDQIDGLRAVLENKRTELARSIRSNTTQLAVCEGEHDLIDRVQGMCSRDEAARFLDGLTRTLADVDAALAAINEGSYGICVQCEEPIASMRLKTIPWASQCIRCQEALERRRHMRPASPRWVEAA
jgi:DnaK suppressor protein